MMKDNKLSAIDILTVALLLGLSLPSTHEMYMLAAPRQFHPGWDYRVVVTVVDEGPLIVSCRLSTPEEDVVVGRSAAKMFLSDGTEDIDIPVNKAIPSDINSFVLRFEARNTDDDIVFSNSSHVQLNRINHVALIQTDKTIYKGGQTVKFRSLIVDHMLQAQMTPFTLTVQNPSSSILAQHDVREKYVHSGTFPLSDIPEEGHWKISLQAPELMLSEEVLFEVKPFVLPTFEVTATVEPSVIDVNSKDTVVTVTVSAEYTFKEPVTGRAAVSVGKSLLSETKQLSKDGTADFVVDLKDALHNSGYGSIPVTATVTDLSDRAYNTTVLVRRTFWAAVRITLDHRLSDAVYRAGTSFQAVITVTDPLGNPLLSDAETTRTLHVELSRENGEILEQKTFQLASNQSQVTWNIDLIAASDDRLLLKYDLTDNGKLHSSVDTIYKYRTVGMTTLNVRWTTVDAVLNMGSDLHFTVDTSEDGGFSQLSYIILSRGNVQMSGQVTTGDNTLTVDTRLCPLGRLVVYGVVPGNVTHKPEIIADSLSLTVEHCQKKQVVFSPISSTHRTGTDVTIKVDVEWVKKGGSQDPPGVHDVYLLGVDRSLFLIQEGDNDISAAKRCYRSDFVHCQLDSQLERYSIVRDPTSPFHVPRVRRRSVMPHRYIWHLPTSTAELFEAVGVLVMTDANVMSTPRWGCMDCVFLQDDVRPMLGNIENKEKASSGGSGGEAPEDEMVTVRKDFRDSWIFSSIATDGDGKSVLTERLPDSITSYQLTAFAVPRMQSVGHSMIAATMQPATVTAFNPFFVSLNLPKWMRRGEKLELKTTVFNYMRSGVRVEVVLAESDHYKIHGSNRQYVLVAGDKATNAVFLMEPVVKGSIDVTVTATGMLPDGTRIVDQVTREVMVRPVGVEQIFSTTLLTNYSSFQPLEQIVQLDYGRWALEDIVPLSGRAMVKITGNMMGNMLTDLGRFLRQPYGCGEQNMITTVPNIYALEYVTTVGVQSAGFTTKAVDNICSGYYRELEYLHDNGGFSAFGKRDPFASTWLTAYVVRSFARAKHFVPDTVDNNVLNKAVLFILSSQNADGSFNETGMVHHSEMQRGTSDDSDSGLSTFITIGLLEALSAGLEIDADSLAKAVGYVERVRPVGVFSAALSAYALALSYKINETQYQRVRKIMADYIGNQAPWLITESIGGANKDEVRYTPLPPTSDIETTAYAVLALVTIGDNGAARDPVLWLQRKQNGYGGYQSTQDTVLALQAISLYSMMVTQTEFTRPIDVSVDILEPSGHSNISYTLTQDNMDILRIEELPDETKRVSVRVNAENGEMVLVKVVWHFYTYAKEPPSVATPVNQGHIGVKVSTQMSSAGQHKISICPHSENLTYNGMMLLSVAPNTGLSLDMDNAMRVMGEGVARMEIDKDSQLNVYYNEPSAAMTCLHMEAVEDLKIGNRQPGSVQYSAYYDPEVRALAELTLATECSGPFCVMSSDSESLYQSTRWLLSTCCYLFLALIIAL